MPYNRVLCRWGPNPRNHGPRRPWSRVSSVVRRLQPDRDRPRDAIHRPTHNCPFSAAGGADRVAVRGVARPTGGRGVADPAAGVRGCPLPLRFPSARGWGLFSGKGGAAVRRGKTARFAPLFFAYDDKNLVNTAKTQLFVVVLG